MACWVSVPPFLVAWVAGAGEMAWLALTLVSAALYGLAWGGPGLLPSSIAQFQLLPMLGALLCHYKRDTYLRQAG